ncbi:hypothetical protein V6N13_050996 [Hibiscus sabdariffa]|uniref:Uncharacterized protein n=1 Tax=Hibiscus sabdariffa TaxID=183260 RepID=A0ABR2T2W7_9ROSI
MKNDDTKGGIKVFNSEENDNLIEENGNASSTVNKRLSLKKSQTVGRGVRKRKVWENESFEGLQKNPIQISKRRYLEHCKDLSCLLMELAVREESVEWSKELSPATSGTLDRESSFLLRSCCETLGRL